VMMNIAGFLGLQDLAKDAFLFPATLIVTLLLVRAIEASPLKKALLR
ncbi:fucose 4-O-acetylase, partial [Vibrio parahaemolyticus]